MKKIITLFFVMVLFLCNTSSIRIYAEEENGTDTAEEISETSVDEKDVNGINTESTTDGKRENNTRGKVMIDTGSCGENATYTIYDDYSMVISGTGDMYDYFDTPAPWRDDYVIMSVTIEAGITSIGDCAFDHLRSLESATIPNTVTSIGNTAFGMCTSLRSIVIPASVTSIEPYAFYWCPLLTDIWFGHTCTDSLSIGAYAFALDEMGSVPTNVYVPDTDNINAAIETYDWQTFRAVNYMNYQTGLSEDIIISKGSGYGYYQIDVPLGLESVVSETHPTIAVNTDYTGDIYDAGFAKFASAGIVVLFQDAQDNISQVPIDHVTWNPDGTVGFQADHTGTYYAFPYERDEDSYGNVYYALATPFMDNDPLEEVLLDQEITVSIPTSFAGVLMFSGVIQNFRGEPEEGFVQLPLGSYAVGNDGVVSFPIDRTGYYYIFEFSETESFTKLVIPENLKNDISTLEEGMKVPTGIHDYHDLEIYQDYMDDGEHCIDVLVNDKKYYPDEEEPEVTDYYLDTETGVVTFRVSEEWLNYKCAGTYYIFNSFAGPIILESCSLTDEGQIGVNFKVFIPYYYRYDSVETEDSIEITELSSLVVTHKGQIITKTASQLKEEDPYFVFTLPLSVKELGDDLGISACTNYYYDFDNLVYEYSENPIPIEIITSSGRKVTSDYTYNPLDDYVSAIVDDDSHEGDEGFEMLADYMTSLSDYVNAAQIYFNYNSENSEIINTAELNGVTEEDLSDFAPEITSTMPEGFGIRHTGVSLVLEDEVTMRHAFVLDGNENIDDYTFTVTDTETWEATVVELNGTNEKYGLVLDNEGRYVLMIRNIPAAELDKVYNIEVSKEGIGYSFDYSALAYAYRVLQLYEGSPDAEVNLKNLVKALYLYNQKADIYYEQNMGN